MQIRAESLAEQLKRRSFAAVWVHGDEPLLQIEACDLAREHYRQAGFSERQVFVIERGFKTDEVDAHAQALSLFANQLLIELRWATKPSKEHGEWLAKMLPGLPDSVRFIMSSARLDRAATEADWYLSLEPFSLIVPVYPVERHELAAWIAQRLARQKQRLDPESLALVCERVEGNLLAAQQEIRKLGLLFGDGDLPANDVREAVLNVARYDPADLTEAMFSGDLARSMRTLRGLQAESAAEPLVLWVLAEAVRSMLRLASAMASGTPQPMALKQARLFPPRDRIYLQALRRDDPKRWMARCTRALRLAAQTDRIIKGLQPGDRWQALESVILSVCADQVPQAALS